MNHIILPLPTSMKLFGAHLAMISNAEDAPLLCRSSEREPDE